MIKKFFFIFVFCFSSLHANNDELIVGVHKPISNYNQSQKDFRIAMGVFTKELANSLHVDYFVKYYDNPENLAKDFKNKKINFAIAEPLQFIKYFDQSLLSNGIIGFKTNKKESQTLIIIGLKKDKSTLNDRLQQGTIVYNNDPSIELYIKLLKKKKKLDSLEILSAKNAQQSILKLFFQKVNLAAVDLAAYKVACELNPQIEQKTIILKEIPHIPMRFIAFMRLHTKKSLQDKVLNVINTLNSTTRGQQLLYLFQAGQVDITQPSDLTLLRKMYEQYTQGQ